MALSSLHCGMKLKAREYATASVMGPWARLISASWPSAAKLGDRGLKKKVPRYCGKEVFHNLSLHTFLRSLFKETTLAGEWEIGLQGYLLSTASVLENLKGI